MTVTPILLFDDECHVCRAIAGWVAKSARRPPGPPRLIVQPIGEDPAALRLLNPRLDIWEAYAAPHLLMPDGAMLRAGYAVAEIFRRLPATRWFAGIFALTLFGVQPFQILLNMAYSVLADLRPVLGCESCGRPSPWVRPLLWIMNRVKSLSGHAAPAPRHFRSLRKSAPPVA